MTITAVSSSSNSTPLFVPATDAIRALVAKAADTDVQIDWAAGVTLKSVEPTSMKIDNADVPVDGLTFIQATAEEKIADQPTAQPESTDTANGTDAQSSPEAAPAS